MLNSSRLLVVAGMSAALLAGCGEKPAGEASAKSSAGIDGTAKVKKIRDQIRIVGSSTVYPFSSYVAEELGTLTDFGTPVVESTGSGGGMKLFCSGTGSSTPDITNASRQMKPEELKTCAENNVGGVTEAKIGFDGIVMAHHASNPPLNLSRMQILLAVAKEVPMGGKLVENPYTNWSQIDPSLPNREITVYGPPKSSGTRDAFEDMILKGLTKKMAEYGNKKYKLIRQDGKYIASGENDNLIVQKLEKNKNALGIFGFSFLEENKEKVQASLVDGVEATPTNISSGKYPISRSLFFYVKNAHVEAVPGVKEYVELFMDDQMIGEGGILTEIGLIPLPVAERAARRASVTSLQPVTAEMLVH